MVDKKVYYYLAQPITHFIKNSGTMALDEFIENHEAAFDFGMKYVILAEKMGITLFSPAVYSCHMAIERYSKACIDIEGERAIWVGIDNKLIDMMRSAGDLRFLFPIGWENSRGCVEEFKDAILHRDLCFRLEEFFEGNGLWLKPIIGNYISEKERKIVDKILDEVQDING